MTHKERFEKALRREKLTGLVPTFELVFYLTMEAFGKVHPQHRHFSQWNQMSVRERELQLSDVAELYVDILKKYKHSAIFVQPLSFGGFDEYKRLLELVKEKCNGEYSVMIHGDTTYAIPNGDNMMDFTARLYEEPQSIIDDQERNIAYITDFASKINKNGIILDGFALCSDYCFNINPFYTNDMFADLIAPALSKTIEIYRQLGFYSIKHTDGNIMPILDMMVECKPDALHSLDPQGGVDLKKVKQLVGDKVCLIGNVNCGLLQTGTEEQVINDVKRSLEDGMNGNGYIFSTSNCVFTGLDLKRYELMLELWEKFGQY